jgi:hypothetical protein
MLEIIPMANETTKLPSHVSERDIMRHIAWLASERRHTTYNDVAFCYAQQRGWCEAIVGIMPSHEKMFRVRLTEEGAARMAMPEQASAGDREFASWQIPQ